MMKRLRTKENNARACAVQYRTFSRLHDGLVRDYLKFKLLSMLERFFNRPRLEVERPNKYKELLKRVFFLVTHGDYLRVKEAIALMSVPSVVSLMFSGMGVLGFIAILALLKKLYRAMVPKK